MNLSSSILASLLISFVITAINPIISPVTASINAASLNIATGRRIADVVEKTKKRPGSLPGTSDSVEKRFKATQESGLQNIANSSDTILLRSKLSGKRTPISGTPTIGKRPFKCFDCGKSFSTRQNFQVHVRIHTGERSFKCSRCEKSFFHSGSLQRHIRIHTGERPFKCDFFGCQMSFSGRSNLRKHIRIHTGERPFKCDFPDSKSPFPSLEI